MAGSLIFGTGFVGRSIGRHLADQGPVAELGRRTHPALAQRGGAAVEVVRAAVEATGATVAVNAAGLLTGSAAALDDANHRWPAWLAEALAGTGVRLVHVGSAAEYGDPGSATPIRPSDPTEPTSDYGRSKLAGTLAVLAAADRGLDAVVVRGFNLVGPSVAPSSPLHQFATDVAALPAEGGTVVVWDAATVRDFVLVEDLAELVAAVAAAGAPPRLVNACSGVGLRYGDIVQAIADRQGKPVTVDDLGRPGIRAVVGDPGPAAAILGRSPEMSAPLLAAHLGAPDLSPE